MMRTNRQNGFTLIETLVVITITIILLGLIFGPVISSFNLTHRARVMTEAQDTARQTLEQIQRELSQAMFVYDNTQSVINCPMNRDPSKPCDLYDMMVPVKYAKIDFVLPKLMMHCNSPNHPASEPRDFERGDKAWPSCPYPIGGPPHEGADDVEARPVQPLRQEPNIVRYFIGLRDNDPEHSYINYYTMDGYPATYSTGAPVLENTYVLYRAEFSIYDNKLFPASMPVSERLAWPDFFYCDEMGENHQTIWQNWRKIVKVVGPDEDVDMITVEWPDGYGSGTPKVTPAIKFTPTGLDNDTLIATYTSDKSSEAPTSCPTTFRATHGHWTPGFKVTVFSGDYQDYYYTDYINGHLWVLDDRGNQVFDISAYRMNKSVVPPNPELMFNVDPNKGEVSFAFSASTVLRPRAIENDFRDKYEDSLANHGIGIGERWAQIGGPIFDDPSNSERIPNAKIIPGSEQVVGPDMTPGPSYLSRMVRYERVPLVLGSAGLNQYRIDYDTGQIWFTSDPNTSMYVDGSLDNIMVTYSFHNNTPEQIVRADYDTKNLLTVALAIRLFDSTTGKPMAVELSDQVQVRNVAR